MEGFPLSSSELLKLRDEYGRRVSCDVAIFGVGTTNGKRSLNPEKGGSKEEKKMKSLDKPKPKPKRKDEMKATTMASKGEKKSWKLCPGGLDFLVSENIAQYMLSKPQSAAPQCNINEDVLGPDVYRSFDALVKKNMEFDANVLSQYRTNGSFAAEQFAANYE